MGSAKYTATDHRSILLIEMDIASLRRNYTLQSLNESDVLPDPIEQFKRWFGEALDSQLPEPNAMILSTASAGRVQSRTVLLKGLDERGLIFYTNYESAKGRELADNPQCALLFLWLELERQIRIEGRAERIPSAESEAYFQSRPRSSQIAAWASPQSAAISDRAALEDKVAEITETFKHDEVLPLPPFWGGFVVVPDRFEFWQGRESRLHDRIVYERIVGASNWALKRLAP